MEKLERFHEEIHTVVENGNCTVHTPWMARKRKAKE